MAAQRACKRCGRPMSSVAEIAPFGGGPGLIALMCTECGTTDSVLVHQAHKSHRRPAAAFSSAPLQCQVDLTIAGDAAPT